MVFFSFVKKSLDRICSTLQQQGTISSFDEPTLKGAFSKEKMQREIEWQRLHPGMDALLSHRSKTPKYEDETKDKGEEDDDEDENSNHLDSDEDNFGDERGNTMIPKKRASSSTTAAVSKRAVSSTTRGRGRGRGRASAPAAALSMTSETINSNSTTPASVSKWPPRRS